MTHLWNLRLGRAKIVFAPEGGAGAGEAGAGDPPAGEAGAGAGDPPAAEAGAGAGDPPAAKSAKWWEGSEFDDETRNWLTARGLADEDVAKVLPRAIKGHREAEKRLGRKPEDLLDRPKDGQSVSEWLAEQRDKLGLPDKEDGYKVDPPEGWPEGAPWDSDMEAEARKLAFEAGIPPEVHQRYVGLYAAKVADMLKAAEGDLAQATDKMMADLRKDWGDQTDVKITQAKQAASVLAEKAGLDSTALNNMAAVLSEKTGDASVLRMFAAIGEMLGDDQAVSIGRNAGSLNMTPAEARQEIARLSAQGGEYHKAFNGGTVDEQQQMQARMTHLSKIAAQGK